MRIIDFFDQGVSLYPDNTAFIDQDSQLSYQEASVKTHHIASGIRGHGFEKGSRVGILAPNSNIAFLALLGTLRAEAVWLPVNPRNPIEVNQDLMSRFECNLIFYHSDFTDQASQLLDSVTTLKEIVCLDQNNDKTASLTEWTTGFEAHFEMGPEDADEVATIYPTGGTTGKSKGVMITHRNLETMFASFWAHFNYHDNTRHLVVAPMTHTAGVLGCLHFPRGGTNIMMAAVDPEGILKQIEQQRITHFFLPPTVLYMLLALPKVREYDYSSLQHFIVGAAPSSLEKLKEALDVFGPVMTEAFGQTEAPAAITAKAPWDYINEDGSINEKRLSSIGRPCVFNQVTLLDEEGNKMPCGEAGEICVRGNLVTPGYLDNPQATNEVRQFGWHHTGDIGVMDEDGYITIVDRKKDMIITGGFNVYPNEIEQVLTQHSAVLDCAVIGVPDEKWGEAIKGVIQLKTGSQVSAEEVIALVKDKLGGVKAPKSIDFVENLPRSPAGKVLKTELRKKYWEGKARAVN